MLPIVIVITESFSDWEIATLAGVGRAFYGAEISFASPDGGPLISAAGLQVADTVRFDAPAEGVVVVCGGPTVEGSAPPGLAERIRVAYGNGCVVAGICGGTAALARAGLLDHARHTSNGPGYLDKLVPDYAGADRYVDQASALRDDRMITAPAAAPASFAVEVLTAAGLDGEAAQGIKAMLAKEHDS